MKKVLFLGVILASMALVACGGGNGGGSQEEQKGPWTVKFNVNGGNETYADQTVENKGLATDPGTPTRSDEKGNYVFQGWRADGGIWSFKNSKVTKDITLVASWLAKYAVSYQNADGTPNGTTTYVDSGTPLEAPATPTAPAGQKFYGWMNVDNGGQIWRFENEQLNKVMADTTLKPLFVSNVDAQVFEAECCPDLLDEKWGPAGMPGMTYSGGAWGLGLVGCYENDWQGNYNLDASGSYSANGKNYTALIQFMYKKNDTLTFELNSDVAATNVTLFMRLSAEYGTPDPETDEVKNTFTDEEFQVIVNDTPVQYGEITLHNIVQKLIPCQDYMVSANLSLNAGSNTIQMKVNNNKTVTSAIKAAAPCVDCIKLISSSTLTWPNETQSNVRPQEVGILYGRI